MPILNWFNKDKAIKGVTESSVQLLECNPDYSYGAPSDNMLIQGDNLEALKALLPLYAGKVKCIFIDPPYNTGKSFGHYTDRLDHSVWLSFMNVRLELLRKLLSEDGSLWVVLDDSEAHYCKVMLDEIFGRCNFVANIVWEKKYSIANLSTYFSAMHDHILCFAKNKKQWVINPLPRTNEMKAKYKNPDNHPKGVWRSTPINAKSLKKTQGVFTHTFINGVTWSPSVGTFPRYSHATLSKLDEGDEIWFGKNGGCKPTRKTFLSELKREGSPPRTIWLHDDVGHNSESKIELLRLNFSEIFDTPKPERLIQRILHLATNTGDLVLDAFLGSGTTAAVAHKMGRKYIGVEIGNHAKTHCYERLKKVVDGEQGGISKAVNWKGGGGFKFYELNP